MTKANMRELIDIFYQRLSRVLAPDRHAPLLYDLCIDEEREHRSPPGFRNHHPGAASVGVCARLFYVRSVLQFLADPSLHAPRVAEFFAIKKSYFGGYALWAANQPAISAEFGRDEARAFLADVEYTSLVPVGGR